MSKSKSFKKKKKKRSDYIKPNNGFAQRSDSTAATVSPKLQESNGEDTVPTQMPQKNEYPKNDSANDKVSVDICENDAKAVQNDKASQTEKRLGLGLGYKESSYKDVPKGKKNALDFDNDAENSLEKKYMTRKERKKYNKEERKHRLSEYSKKEKFKYYLFYYKWPVIIGTILIVALSKILFDVISGSLPNAVSIALLNNSQSNKFQEYITEEYRDKYPDLKSYEKVVVEGDYDISLDTYLDEFSKVNSDNLTDAERLTYKQRADTYDVIISDEKGIAYCSEMNLITRVDVYLDKSTYQLVKDHLFYYKLNGNTYSAAIDISDTEFAKGLGLDYDKIYVAFPGTSDKNLKNAKRFVELIFK